MRYFIQQALQDWAYKVNDGCPDPQNRTHMQVLEAVLRQHGCPEDFISEYIPRVQDPSRSSCKTFQEFCVEVGKTLSEEALLTEASVWDNKYTAGTEYIAIKSTDALFTKGGVTPPKGPFFKAAADDSAIEVNIGSGVTFYIKADGNVYKITGSKSMLKGMFGKVGKGKSGSNVKWDEKTLESAACTGLYFNAVQHYGKINTPDVTLADQQAAISAFEGALGTESAGASGLKGKLIALPDLLLALQLAIGVQKFAEAHGCKGWNFIHKSIDKFYTAGYSNGNLDTKGFKDNTADTIITKSSPATLISNIAKDKITFDSNGKCTTESGDEFYQISNKKSDGGAQLGRIVKSFRDMYGTKTPADTWKLQLTTEIITHGDSLFILNEGLADYFKQGLKFLKDKFTSLLDVAKSKVASFGSSIVSKLSVKITKPSSTLDKFMKGRYAKGVKQLGEAKKKPNKYTYWEYAEMASQLAINGNMSELKSLHSKVTDEWKVLKKLLDIPMDGVDGTRGSSGPNLVTPSSVKDGSHYALKLMTNFMGYEHLTAMLKSEAGNVKNVSTVLEEFVELEKEMYFGRTELPLFKVYGTDPSGKAYEFLKSGKEFREDRLNAMDMGDAVKDGKYIPGVVVESSVQTAGHASVKIWILHSLTESGVTYTQVDMRSSNPDTLSFSVSGGSIIRGDLVLKRL
tara:strand:- start:471 stop:2525 length:2055 start_codon:yes stop_codon:yes gene_type:complete